MQRFIRTNSLIRKAIAVAVALASVASTSTSISAADWPQWRGPNRDGVSTEKGWTTKWPEKGPKVLWKAYVNGGYSSFAVVGGRVYTMGNALDKPGPDGKLILITDDGELVVAEASPKAYKELARAKVFPSKSKSWVCPVLCGGRIYCRGGENAVCLDVKGQ